MGQRVADYSRIVNTASRGGGLTNGRCALHLEGMKPEAISPDDVVAFWQRSSDRWFSKDPAFDAELAHRFLQAHVDAAAGRLDSWLDNAAGALALVILVDQFPRNAFRGTPRMYATDRLARFFADRAVAAGYDAQVPRELRLFFYLPFAHSEELADQERSVALHRHLGYTANAERHRGIIRRFGRFPHRNAILGRATTSEERRYLEGGGFAG
jgi:uncharacterized protein (DUF924 family)